MKNILIIFFILFSFKGFSQSSAESHCVEEVESLFSKFKPEFLELQSKLALYKTAWTTLVLNKASGKEMVTMEKEISDIAKKIAEKRKDPAFDQEYKELMRYKPYVDKWETKTRTKLPLAIKLLAQNVHTPEFHDLVFKKTNDKTKMKEELKKYSVDLETVKTSEVLHDLYKNDSSSNNYLLKLNNQVSAALRGRDSVQGRDKDYFENLIDKISDKINQNRKEFIQELEKVCGSEAQALNIINKNIICKNNNPSTLLVSDLEKIFEFEPILDKLNEDAKLAYIRKEYLKVSPNNPQCVASKTDKNILFDVSSVPKNGDYELTFYRGENAIVSLSVLSGNFKFDYDLSGNLIVFNKKTQENEIITPDDISSTKLISSWGNKKNGVVTCSIKGSKSKSWQNYNINAQKINLKILSSDEQKIMEFEASKGKGNYLIIDEKNGKLKVLTHKGELLTEVAIKEGFDQGDEYYGARGNKTLGAGVYSVERHGKSSHDGPDNILHLKDSKNQGISIRDENSACEKCIRIPTNSLSLVMKSLPKKSTIYVLPENNKNSYQVSSHGNLSFKPSFGENDYYYNAPKKFDYHPSNFSLTKSTLPNPKDTWTKPIPGIGRKDIQLDTQVTQEFLKTLAEEKYNLMKLYNLSNDEYNEIAKLAFGILGNESYFGKPSFPRAMKEVVPAAVPIAKNFKSFDAKDRKALDKLFEGEFKEAVKLEKEALGELWEGVKGGFHLFKNSIVHYNPNLPGTAVTATMLGSMKTIHDGDVDISSNSRGLIQMKNVPDKIEKEYGISKEDLMNPSSAAISAVGFLAEAKYELEQKAKTYNKNVVITRDIASGKRKNDNLEIIEDYEYADITHENWMEYVHYIYMGSSREITDATATPDYNLYYKDIRYWNTALELEERE